ncbi:unnamed protein product [Clonostachys byssicola]|uniref:Uncharacterized protein n=1 Tax=Clonostachys byssicola TaxID=160290 RepID=A0A9N9UNL7_9HYPO|nr:unnamed protein product [Clonostachys byssicola]
MAPGESHSPTLEQSSAQWEQISYPSSPSESLWQPSVSDLIADTNEATQVQNEVTYQRYCHTPPAQDSNTPIPVGSKIEGDNEDTDTVGASTNLIPTEAIETRKLFQKPTWRPFWLQRSIMIAFSGFFFGSAIAVLSILFYSERSKGLATVQMELANLWRFGPPAVLAIVSTLWARVEFQTLRYFPWMTVHKDTTFSGHHITSLDYTSLILPKVMFLSLKRKDTLVCLASVLAILMKAQVVLSASLFYSKAVEHSFPLEIELLDSFQTKYESDFRYDKFTYFAAKAFHDFRMNLPFGITEEAAYQTFKPAGSDTVIRGTSDMPITVTVDALFTDIQCLPMKECESSVTRQPNNPYYNYAFDLLFEGCDRPVHVEDSVNWWSSESKMGSWTKGTIKETPPPCPSLPTQFHPFVYVGQRGKDQNGSMPVVTECAAIICSPTAWVSKVEIHDDGIKPVLRLLPDKEVIEVNSNPWNLLENVISLQNGSENEASVPWASPVTWLEISEVITVDESLFQNEKLITAVQNLTKAYGPFVSNTYLRENGKFSTIGSRIEITQKLQMNQRICIAMAVIFAVSALAVIWVVIEAPRICETCPRDPGTILGSAILLHGDSKFTSSIQEKIEVEEQQGPCQHEACGDPFYSPFALQCWFRIIFAFYTLGLIISITTLLHISYRSDGIITLAEGSPSLWWTSVPAIATVMIAWYSSSSDMALRDLAIISKLSSKAMNISALDMSLSDMLGVRALYHSFRLKATAISLSLILAILSGFLSPLSATLFTSQAIPGTHDVLVKQTSWFGPYLPDLSSPSYSWQTELTVGSTLVNNQVNNFTYPEFTYGDLVFPSVEIDTPNTFWSSKNSIKVNVTAAKLISDCSRPLPGDYDLTVSKNDQGTTATIDRKPLCPNGKNISEPQQKSYRNGDTRDDVISYFAGSIPTPEDSYCEVAKVPWIFHGFSWGKFSDSAVALDHLSLWTCNSTLAQVPAELTLLSTDGKTLQLDYRHPPVPDLSKLKPYEPPLVVSNKFLEQFGSESVFFSRVNLTNIGHIFPAVVEPLGSFRLESLADPDQDLKLIEAAKHQFAILAAQLISIKHRYSVNESSDLTPLKGIVVDNNRLRLVQNFPVTVTMIVILSLVLAFHTWGLISTGLRKALGGGRKWLLDLELKGVAPPGFSSISMMNDLLNGSNIHEHLPRGADFMSAKDISKSFKNLECRLGWFYNTRTEQQQYTVGIIERDEFEFVDREKC